MLQHILDVLDDTKHPNSVPSWLAGMLAALTIWAIIRLIVNPLIDAYKRRNDLASRYDALKAHKQKLHEHDNRNY